MRPWLEERIGCLLAAAGVIWAVYHGTYEAHNVFQGFTAVYLKTGPLETSAIGILLWLHAKWRKAASVDR